MRHTVTRREVLRVYSDEAGMRKPKPAIFHLAAGALGVAMADCRCVGDQPDRDVVGGRRAGAAKVILLADGPDGDEPSVAEQPDHVIGRLRDVLALLPDE